MGVFRFTQMTQEEAEAVAAWRYPEPYSFYDWTADADDLRELLEPELRGEAYWAVRDEADELAGYFSFKPKADGEVEFVITVKEFAPRNNVQMRFYAQADKEVNQKTARFRPFGWGDSLLAALTECIRIIRQHPYEPE